MRQYWEIVYLIGTGDDARKPVLSLPLTFDHCLDYTGVIGTKVHKAMSNTSLHISVSFFIARSPPPDQNKDAYLPYCLEKGERCGIPESCGLIEVRSAPRILIVLTVLHRANLVLPSKMNNETL